MKRHDLADRVYEGLLSKIAAQELEPGAWIVEAHIAEEFGVSRTTVRAALQTLITQGVLEKRINHRCFVAQHGPTQICELLEVREVLEGLAARLMAARRDGMQVMALRDLCDAMDVAAREQDASRFAQKDFEFHRLLAHACGSEQLTRFTNVDNVILLTMLYYPLLAKPPWARLRTGGAIPEHRGIVEAIEARDPKAAEAAARLHVEAAREDLEQAMEEADVPKRKLVVY